MGRVKLGRQLVWLDLCSGLGGASQPALDRGWKVIRVDIEPRFKPDIVADVRMLPLKPFHVDVLWASPPCQEFSKHQLRCFYPDPAEPRLEISRGVKQAIETLAPQWWVVENVWAARPWLSKLFGQVRAKPPGHALWSNLGFLLPNLEPHKGGMGYWASGRWGAVGHGPNREKGWTRTGHNGANAAEAARIPYEIGEAVCAAVERLQENGATAERADRG